MKIEWMTPNQTVPAPAVAFGFDSVDQLVNGQVTVSWLRAEASPIRFNNLVIYDIEGVSTEILGLAIIATAGKPLVKHRKGRLVDGTARDVYPILNDPDLPFRAGLTVHAARGTWSSLPHKFEVAEILTPRPMPFYEKFAYVTDPPGGWGVQMRIGHLYGTSPDDNHISLHNGAVIIRDRDILSIPLGSHPVVAAPGTRLIYFWCYWSDGPAAAVTMSQREKF